MALPEFRRAAAELAAAGQRFYARGWALGTSGNFSALVSRKPFRMTITASGLSKRTLSAPGILECDERGNAVGRRRGRPSAETLLHIEILKRGTAAAVLHTHSVWSTMLSGRHSPDEGFALGGYEMLKGLAGVTSHEHEEWIPILANDQDIPRLAKQVAATLDRHPDAHAFLLERHGLYTWGDTIADAERHVEILEFLFEVHCRMEGLQHCRS